MRLIRTVTGLIFGYLLLHSALVAAPFAYVPNTASESISVIDIQNNKVIATIKLNVATPVIAINPGGTRAYITSLSKLLVINTFTNTVTDGPNFVGEVKVLELNADGTRLYAAARSFSGDLVCILELATGIFAGCINVGGNIQGLAVSPDGSRLYATNFSGNTISIVDTSAFAVVGTITLGGPTYGVVFNHAGTRAFVTGQATSTVTVIDTFSKSVVATIGVGNFPRLMVVNADDSRLYVANGDSGSVSVIDTASNSVVATVPVGLAPHAMGMAPKGDRLYVANGGGSSVSVIRVPDNVVVDSIPVGVYPSAQGKIIGGGKLLDIDGDGEVTATIDMLLLMRWQLGFRGAAIMANWAPTAGATRKTVQQIEAYLTHLDALGGP